MPMMVANMGLVMVHRKGMYRWGDDFAQRLRLAAGLMQGLFPLQVVVVVVIVAVAVAVAVVEEEYAVKELAERREEREEDASSCGNQDDKVDALDEVKGRGSVVEQWGKVVLQAAMAYHGGGGGGGGDGGGVEEVDSVGGKEKVPEQQQHH